MSEQPRTSVYLGPDRGRWTPRTWADVLAAAAGGMLDESPWVDLKQEIPAGKRDINTELAKDLASFAVDGGLLLVGIEDRDSHAGKVVGVELAGLADRVDQVARAKVQPPLTVRSYEIPDPDRPGWGCLLVLVPPSPDAPHMVDYVHYGRGDRGNDKLSYERVRAIIEGRRRHQVDAVAELRQMAGDDPIPEGKRKYSHLYLLAQPETAPEETLVELLVRPDAVQVVQGIAQQTMTERPHGFYPDLSTMHYSALRAEGLALTSDTGERGERTEGGLVELVVREDGGVRLICGRATDSSFGPRVWPEPDQPPMAVLVNQIVGLTYSLVATAGRLADEHGSYQGQWRLGIRMDRLRGVVPVERLHGGFLNDGPGVPYSRDEYEKTTTAYTEELVNDPRGVMRRLLAPLLRGLGVSSLYFPVERLQTG